jgi:hypothetical protein
VADAMALASADDRTAGQVYNVVDSHVEFAAIVAEDEARSRRGSPGQRFDNAKAIAFFDRHGEPAPLRRGAAGVKAYIAELQAALKARPQA